MNPLGRPEVGAHLNNRVDEVYDVWKFAIGFKDGVFLQTGNNSLFMQCNYNLSDTNEIYYYNFYNLFKDAAINFGESANRDNSIATMFLYVRKALQWPFLTFNSCYWATTLLYDPYLVENMPNIMGEMDPDGTYKDVSFWEQLGYNILFNLGFIILDLRWMI